MFASHGVSFEELVERFHLPFSQVAEELGICSTVLKKICRRNGIPRWPYRRLKSIKTVIRNLESTIPKTPEEQKNIIAQIEELKAKELRIIKNPSRLLEMNFQHRLKNNSIKKKSLSDPVFPLENLLNSPSLPIPPPPPPFKSPSEDKSEESIPITLLDWKPIIIPTIVPLSFCPPSTCTNIFQIINKASSRSQNDEDTDADHTNELVKRFSSFNPPPAIKMNPLDSFLSLPDINPTTKFNDDILPILEPSINDI